MEKFRKAWKKYFIISIVLGICLTAIEVESKQPGGHVTFGWMMIYCTKIVILYLVLMASTDILTEKFGKKKAENE